MTRSQAARLAVTGLVWMLASPPAFAAEIAPTIDGQIDDLIELAAATPNGEGYAFSSTEPTHDVLLIEPSITPCAPVVDNYYASGLDQRHNVIVHDRASRTLYLGLAAASVVGDLDGNGSPDTQCPESTLEDATGVGPDERYEWDFFFGCNRGQPDMTVTLTDNRLVVSGVSFTSQEYSIAGGDLEIALRGGDIPLAVDVRVFSGSLHDGQNEDFAFMQLQPPSNVSFALASTSVPGSVCPGGSTTVTIEIENDGSAPLQKVDVTDALPPGMRYVAGSARSACGVGEPTLADGVLTWPTFALEPGAHCRIAFDLIADASCSGAVEARATVIASFSHRCLFGGDPVTLMNERSVSIACTGVPCAPESPCVVGGHGCGDGAGEGRARERHTFGGDVQACAGGSGASGTWEHVVRTDAGTALRFVSADACVTSCRTLDGGACASATFAGTGQYTRGDESARAATFSSTVVDRDQSGCEGGRDEYQIEVRDQETGSVVLAWEQQPSSCGQLRVSGLAAGVGLGGPELVPAPSLPQESMAANQTHVAPRGAYPNPFAAAMSYGYEVPADGEPQKVHIGVYDAAGRLVSRLMSEVQGPGRYTVRWDGRDAAGVQMAPGVYFLKSRVGRTESVSRLLKIAE